MSSSSLSRLLYRGFCTSSSSVSTEAAAAAAAAQPLKPIINDLYQEQNLNKVVEKFKKSSDIYRFRCKHNVYAVTVRRLAKAKRFNSIEEILEQQKKYKDITNEGFAIRLIDLYGKSGMPDHASKLFDEMPDLKCERTVKSFNALLNAYVDSKNSDNVLKVENLFREYPSKFSITPDEYSYNIVIRAYCGAGSLDSALSMLTEMEKNGIKPSLITFNTLLNAFYAKGSFSDAEKIWVRMEESELVPDVRSYNAKLRGLVGEGKTAEAVKLVEEMKTGEVKPDVFSFNALIQGLCKEGKIEEAIRIYDELVANNCAPILLTYQLLVPALCAKGDFGLALKLCKAGMSRRHFLDAGKVQAVVDGLIKESKVVEAKELVELAKTKSYGNSSLAIPSDIADKE